MKFLINNSKINTIMESDNINLLDSNDSFNFYLIQQEYIESDKSIFIILPDINLSVFYYEQLSKIIGTDNVLFYPADEILSFELLLSNGDFKYERINTLINLLDNKKQVVITNLSGALKFQFPKERFEQSILKLSINDTYNMQDLLNKLIRLGYTNTYTVVSTGHFSRRGSIIDIFPLNYQNPIRLDFFDDEIETIKTFDINTQRSLDKIESIEILPVTEMLSTIEEDQLITSYLIDKKDNTLNIKSSTMDRIQSDLEAIGLSNNKDYLIKYLPLLNLHNTILDFKTNKRIYMLETQQSCDLYNHMVDSVNNHDVISDLNNLLNIELFMNINYLLDKVNVYSNYNENINSIKVNSEKNNDLKADKSKIVTLFKNSLLTKKVIVCFSNSNYFEFTKDLLTLNNINYFLNEKNINANGIYLFNDLYFPSFELVYDDLIVINDETLFELKAIKRKAKFKSIFKNSTKISKHDELNIGDYVVHYNYGIGKYEGLITKDEGGLKRDYIHITYAKKSSLYIPLEQINMIQKYSNYDSLVTLTDISSSSWSRTKIKVREKVRDLTDKLIKLYANRKIAEGFAFTKDNEEIIEFEKDFLFELTVDQKRAFEEIKCDMESSKPMDRLICADVGYGKTELAIRACFKAILDSKQVCILAPTTILTRQHYHTFKSRLEKYGFKVELYNRFVSSTKRKEILNNLSLGNVDVIIGTHGLLNPLVKYKDLGLLIVDEEQRFGVTHKEKIKELKISVDTITLSATPIPRTLQMSIVGLKDLSMIETPPLNRYPIQTYILERNDVIIKDAISKEIARGGQVFYLYNKVESIYAIYEKLQKLIPSAKICIGHGQLKKEELEDTLCKFIDKEFDVLLCTTIIETGIDIPDANTILVHDANQFGLSQLYQIRGRVGRSDKVAYAYLMYDNERKLTLEAIQRLEALKEYSDLGSGFKIAMRDLSIRGAGNILGDEQSGFVDSIGIDTYMRILEEEITNANKSNLSGNIKSNGDEVKHANVLYPNLKTGASYHIDTNYISNEDVRIEIHKKIDKIRTLTDLNKLEDELLDRFSYFNNELKFYMYDKLFRILCNQLGIDKILYLNNHTISLSFSVEVSNKINGDMIFNLSKDHDRIQLRYINKQITILYDKTKIENELHLVNLVNFLNIFKETFDRDGFYD
ncbi:MAG: transcription-repair coupling factor [Anaeroplasmataceae bacterium]